MINQALSSLAELLGYEDEMPSCNWIRGTNLFLTIKFNLIHFFNYPTRFHTCVVCKKKFLCHNSFLTHGKNHVHYGCMSHWLDLIGKSSLEKQNYTGVKQ